MKIASRIHRMIGYDGAALLMLEFCVFAAVLYGVRKPDYTESQKDFRALIVVVTDKPVSNEHWTLIKNDLLKQETQGAVNDEKQTNFWEATGGRATLTLSGIDKFLKQ